VKSDKKNQIINLINLATKEDKIHQDITSKISVSKNLKCKMFIKSKNEGILFGVNIIILLLKKIDKKIKIKIFKPDGSKLRKGTKILSLEGKAHSILKSERTMLNFLGHLSGIASETNKLVKKTRIYKTKICCTRKTIPGLRYLQKQAIKIGGGYNNRYDLKEEIFVKDNHHIDKLNFREKIMLIKKRNRTNKKINVEVDNIRQLKEIVDLKIDRILLDNFSPLILKKALRIIPSKIDTEASGNITPQNIIKYAKTGVKRISLGYLTHSVKNFNFSLEF
tara:strand:- start:43 stop:879 length:837 start_codon:yes stop_codon:yes gene_type:complete